MIETGAAVAAFARQWVGTPYRHQASLKGHGADCLGLVRGVWKDLYGEAATIPPPYSRDWSEVTGEEVLWQAAARWLEPSEGNRIGDVLLFRMTENAPAKHLAIRGATGTDSTIIHAYSGRSVIEMPFRGGWRRRCVAVFQFPKKV